MNTLAQQRRILAVSAMVTFTIGILAAYERGEGDPKTNLPSARFFVGIGMSYTICSIMVDLGQGGLGAGFAVLIMLSATLTQGDEALKLLLSRSKVVNPKPLRGIIRGNPNKIVNNRTAHNYLDTVASSGIQPLQAPQPTGGLF